MQVENIHNMDSISQRCLFWGFPVIFAAFYVAKGQNSSKRLLTKSIFFTPTLFFRSESEDDAEMTAVGDNTSLMKDLTLSEEKQEEEDLLEEERGVESVMNWDFDDFSTTDHRLQLYCDLSLFR